MKVQKLIRFLPDWKNAALAVISAILLILAFPDFEFWFLAWFALVPLLWAIERENESPVKSFAVGWLFGTIFFFGTCWWLTFAPITYAGFPSLLAYFLMLCVSVAVGIFPGIFSALLSLILNRYGNLAILSAPFIWIFTEFLRYWLTGNNWNAIGYSQAFNKGLIGSAEFGGIYLVGFWCIFLNSLATLIILSLIQISAIKNNGNARAGKDDLFIVILTSVFVLPFAFFPTFSFSEYLNDKINIIAIQPNVPMAGLTYEKWKSLRQKHAELAESALAKLPADNRLPTTVIFPESPMNFAYEEDEEFQRFVHAFAAKHDVNVLFNSAEPDAASNKYFNSAVLVGPQGTELAQYDKIYLVPFGESVPAPLQSIVPAFVGSFSYGSEYDLVPLGDAKAGIMICFESHFGQLSREYVRNGADVLIEMTNDGYLGPTPVLRQHLANAVFRAVETNRPVLRVTNVGITAYIDERGQVIDPAASYTEDTRIWSVSKSDGGQTFYVRYGDWFAWLCSVITIVLLISVFVRTQRIESE
ncbi:MAG: apolipoprotein N-acyltransferase [Saprospiraceae bacterium]|nr:apolipoprotein N-acyltransferase [Pyrinomonadaceae bacterium]